MKLEKLRVRNFRNWSSGEFNPSEGLNFIFGSNGQGKTSLLEAVGLLSSLKSFRTHRLEELIQRGSDEAEIEALLVRSNQLSPGESSDYRWECRVKVVLQRDSSTGRCRKVAFINGKPYKSAMGYLSQRYGEVGLGFHSVVFNPSDHDLVRGEPAYRRAVIDRIVAAENLDHLQNVQRFQKVLDQRNALFKSESPIDFRVLDGFTEPLVELGSRVTQARWAWFESASELIRSVAKTIAPSQQDVGVSYSSKWAPHDGKKISNFNELAIRHFTGQCKTPSLELFKHTFAENLAQYRALELRNRTTLVGPHRDDWHFTLGEQSLQAHGSQGEVRSALLAFKIAEVNRFQLNCGHAPLFLLDDFSSELDEQRRNFLLGFLESSQLQVFVTTTDQSVSAGKRFEVSEGSCRELGRLVPDRNKFESKIEGME